MWEFWIMLIFFDRINQPFALRLVQQMESINTKMQAEYDTLTNLLSEATVNPENMDKFLGCNSEIGAWLSWPFKQLMPQLLGFPQAPESEDPGAFRGVHQTRCFDEFPLAASQEARLNGWILHKHLNKKYYASWIQTLGLCLEKFPETCSGCCASGQGPWRRLRLRRATSLRLGVVESQRQRPKLPGLLRRRNRQRAVMPRFQIYLQGCTWRPCFCTWRVLIRHTQYIQYGSIWGSQQYMPSGWNRLGSPR